MQSLWCFLYTERYKVNISNSFACSSHCMLDVTVDCTTHCNEWHGQWLTWDLLNLTGTVRRGTLWGTLLSTYVQPTRYSMCVGYSISATAADDSGYKYVCMCKHTLRCLQEGQAHQTASSVSSLGWIAPSLLCKLLILSVQSKWGV